MKKILSIFLAVMLCAGLLAGCEATGGSAGATNPKAAEILDMSNAPAPSGGTDLVVYGSTEEEHLAATVNAFMDLTGYKVEFQRLSAGEVQTKVSEEVKAGGKPSADVFFGGTNTPVMLPQSESEPSAMELRFSGRCS